MFLQPMGLRILLRTYLVPAFKVSENDEAFGTIYYCSIIPVLAPERKYENNGFTPSNNSFVSYQQASLRLMVCGATSPVCIQLISVVVYSPQSSV